MALPGLGKNSVGATSYGEDIPLGQEREIDGEKKYWSGQNYGFQSKESYQKLGDEGYFAGRTSGANPVHETLFGNESAQRVISSGKELIKTGFEAVTTEDQRGSFQKYVDTTMGLAGMAINNSPQLRSLMTTMGLVDQGVTEAAKATNIGKPQLELVTDVLSGGAGKAKGAGTLAELVPQQPQLRFGLAGVDGGYGNVMKAVTTTNKEVLGTVGVKTGDKIITPEQGKRLIKRSAEIENKKGTIERINTDIEALTELKSDPKNLQKYIDDSDEFLQSYWNAEGGNVDRIVERLKNAKERAQPALSQAQSNVAPFTKDGDFQQWYKTVAGKNARSAEAKARGIKQVLQEHHLFPKGISAAYFDAMDRLISKGKAKPDDLVLMFEYAVKKGRTPGDYKVNIKNLPAGPHGTLHNQGFRTKGYKAELPKSHYVNQLKDVNDVDDLMERWVEILDDDVAYQMETAQIWEDMAQLITDVQK